MALRPNTECEEKHMLSKMNRQYVGLPNLGPVTSKSSMVRYKQEGSIPERVDIHLRLIEGVYNYDRLRTFGIV